MVLRKHAIYIVTIRCTSREGGRSLIEDIVDPRSSSSKEQLRRGKIYIYIYLAIVTYINFFIVIIITRDHDSRPHRKIFLFSRAISSIILFLPYLFVHRTCSLFYKKKIKKKRIYVQRQIASSNA